MGDKYLGPERRTECPATNCTKPDDAAKEAVKRTFAILGVDVDDPQQLEEFRKGLRFGEDLVIMSKRGKIAAMTTAIGLLGAAIWNSFIR